MWATLIALFDGDDVVVGVVSAPALARRWWAAVRLMAPSPSLHRSNQAPCRVSAVANLTDASLVLLRTGGMAVGRPRSRLHRAVRGLLADQGVRRLLLLHAGRRGCGRCRHRARAEPVGRCRPDPDCHRGRRPDRPQSTVSHPAAIRAAPWPRTGYCTARSLALLNR